MTNEQRGKDLDGLIEVYLSCERDEPDEKIERLIDLWEEWKTKIVPGDPTKTPTFPFTPNEVEYLGSNILDGLLALYNHRHHVQDSLYFLLTSEHYQSAKWYYETVHHDLNSIVTWACMDGYLDVVKWIYDTYSHMRGFIESTRPLHFACTHGHLEIAKWLVNKRPKETWTSELANMLVQPYDLNETFVLVCEYGRLDVAKWLLETFPNIDPRWRDYLAWRRVSEQDAYLCRDGLYLHQILEPVREWLEAQGFAPPPQITIYATNNNILRLSAGSLGYPMI